MVMDVQPNMLIILQYIQISLSLCCISKTNKMVFVNCTSDRQTDRWMDTKAASQGKK